MVFRVGTVHSNRAASMNLVVSTETDLKCLLELRSTTSDNMTPDQIHVWPIQEKAYGKVALHGIL